MYFYKSCETEINIFPTFTIHVIFWDKQMVDLRKFFIAEFQLMNAENDRSASISINSDGEVCNK